MAREIHWDDLRIFLAVCRAETLSGAARGLRIDPATVMRRIARLEEAAGQPLFLRSPQGYRLATAGERLLPHAEEVERALAEAAGEMRGEGGALTGTVRIGAPDGCANFLLPQICAAIQAENPRLDIQVVALPRVVSLSKREADMAITVSAPQAGRLTVQKIGNYHLSVAASDDYLRRHPPIRSLDDLRTHAFAGYIPDMIGDPELDYLAEFGNPRVGFASNSVSVQFWHIVRGHAPGVVHEFALPAAPTLRRVLPDLRLRRSFWLLRPVEDRRSERLNRFAAALVAGMRAELERLEPPPGHDVGAARQG